MTHSLIRRKPLTSLMSVSRAPERFAVREGVRDDELALEAGEPEVDQPEAPFRNAPRRLP